MNFLGLNIELQGLRLLCTDSKGAIRFDCFCEDLSDVPEALKGITAAWLRGIEAKKAWQPLLALFNKELI